MPKALTQEVGLLRTIVRNLERTLIPIDPSVAAFCRAQGIEAPSGNTSWKTTIHPPGHAAFNDLSECLIAHFPTMERGTNFANFQSELFKQLETYVGREPASIEGADAQTLLDHLNESFKDHASLRKVFVPCVLTPWAASRFDIGPVTFVHIDTITTSEFYPPGPTPDILAKHSFDTLIELMRETHANWLARVAVEGCEQQRAEEIGELAVDLAIVALQLAAPYLDTRSMCRLDSRRGRDPVSTSAEYMAEFRSDIESFIGRETIESAVISNRYELPRVESRSYVGFVDPSGGSADSMTLGIAHREGEKAILDCLRDTAAIQSRRSCRRFCQDAQIVPPSPRHW